MTLNSRRRLILKSTLGLPAALVAARAESARCIVADYRGGGTLPGLGGPNPMALPCTPPPKPVSQWTAAEINAIYQRKYNEYIGAVPTPPDSFAASSPDDPTFRAMLTPGEYADVSDLANLFGVGGGLGTLGGGYVLAQRGMALGGLFGLGAGLAFWVGWQIGTFVYRGGSRVYIIQRIASR